VLRDSGFFRISDFGFRISALAGLLSTALLWTAVLSSRPCAAGGVTIITHGLNGDVDGWITGMATNIPNYHRFAGTNFTSYEMFFYYSGGSYYLTSARVGGSQPFEPETGEIIIKLDWRQLADGNSYNTYQIATAVVPALLSTNFIPELGGHALAEFPMHLIGHSRGGSLICEMSRLLGTNGVWVDHLTTLDPHPLNNDGFNLDRFLYSAVDASARTYANVLFHDNYWQEIDFLVRGEPVTGAYIREFNNLSGGYSLAHSDVHLWYHGTVDLRTPTTDTEASLTNNERNNWWVPYESRGALGGFYYSLIGGGNRLSADQPVGQGFPAIEDGYNQWWDLGAGTSANRTALTSNNGSWPSLIKFNRIETNSVLQNQTTPVKYYYQWAQPANSTATISFYIDADFNPLNSNQKLVGEVNVPGTTSQNVSYQQFALALNATNASPGDHALFAKITANGRSRYLYAPELVRIISIQPPSLDIANLSSSQFRIGVNGAIGQTIILQYSTNLQTWFPLVTNTLASNRWVYTNAPAGDSSRQFYRAILSQ